MEVKQEIIEKRLLDVAWGANFGDYKDCKSNVNYTSAQMSEWYIEMRDSNPNPFPCILS